MDAHRSRRVFVFVFVATLALALGGACDDAHQSPAPDETATWEAGLTPTSALACDATSDCADGRFCRKPVGQCGEPGICVSRPTSCSALASPVCGCDGKTYGSACLAAVAGVSVSAKGGCAVTTLVCKSSAECDDGTFCRKRPGACAHAGRCAKKPAACPDLWSPVCGCDGVTYPSACEAAMAGAAVDYSGKCKVPTCKTNGDCAATQYCRKKPGSCDGEGLCTARPHACPDLWAPVCGCDDVTHGNSCEAAAAGAAVAAKGECPPPKCGTNADCAKSELCQKPDGACDETGWCEARPTICPTLWDPVCGCDGETWPNACSMNASGVTKLHDGACAPECVAVDPWGFGVCAMFLGFAFDGAACVGVSGCSCGDQCDHIYATKEECEKVCADQLNPCVANGGFCWPGSSLTGIMIPWPEMCPPGSAEVDLGGCDLGEICCMKAEPPSPCEEAGGLCLDALD